jgi:hypothetical protein
VWVSTIWWKTKSPDTIFLFSKEWAISKLQISPTKLEFWKAKKTYDIQDRCLEG